MCRTAARRIATFVLIAATALLAAPVAAQGWMSSDGGMSLSIGAGNYLLSQQVLKDAAGKSQQRATKPAAGAAASGSQKPAPVADTRFSRRGGYAAALDTIAGAYPAAQRSEARAGFAQLLGAYPQVLQQLGQPENDLAVGMAAFIAGNYSGFNNVPFPDDKFPALVAQMRDAMQADPQIGQLTAASKQELNDVLAAVAMQMVTVQGELQKRPDRALERRLRQASQQYFSDVLGIDAGKVRITSAGMVL